MSEYPDDIIKAADDVCISLNIPSTVDNCEPIMAALMAGRGNGEKIIQGLKEAIEYAKGDAPSPHVDLLEASERILPYLNFTIGNESPGFHPTMPSAVGAFKRAVETARSAPPNPYPEPSP